jgi:hypothetical protein
VGDVAQFGTAGALIALLAGVIGYLLNSNRQDRTQHQDIVDKLRAHIVSLEERRDLRIEKLEARIEALEAEAEAERSKRHAAEALTAAAEIRARMAEYQLALHQPPEVNGT